jgi:hypothetical protein
MNMQNEEFTAEEIADAQAALNLYPARSAYWDSFSGQDALEVVIALGMKPSTSDAQVRDAYRALCASIQAEADAA